MPRAVTTLSNVTTTPGTASSLWEALSYGEALTDLAWSGCPNARDLGALPTRYGGVTWPRALVRTDSLDNLDEAGRAAFVAHGAGLILDLRSDWELTEPHPSAGGPSYQRIATVAIPNPFVAAGAVAAADLVLDSAAERPLAEVLREVSRSHEKIGAP
jgi:hypothetical protein